MSLGTELPVALATMEVGECPKCLELFAVMLLSFPYVCCPSSHIHIKGHLQWFLMLHVIIHIFGYGPMCARITPQQFVTNFASVDVYKSRLRPHFCCSGLFAFQPNNVDAVHEELAWFLLFHQRSLRRSGRTRANPRARCSRRRSCHRSSPCTTPFRPPRWTKGMKPRTGSIHPMIGYQTH